jgi:hypothetical protein
MRLKVEGLKNETRQKLGAPDTEREEKRDDICLEWKQAVGNPMHAQQGKRLCNPMHAQQEKQLCAMGNPMHTQQGKRLCVQRVIQCTPSLSRENDEHEGGLFDGVYSI